jgi:5-methylcytosine-specific restriction endonuclease McrA
MEQCHYCKSDMVKGKHKERKFCNKYCFGKYHQSLTNEKFKLGLISDRDTLRRILRRIGEYKCSVCGIERWNDALITLQIDHINGNAGDNSPVNLRLICPNCHSQTEFFSGANKGNGRKTRNLRLK